MKKSTSPTKVTTLSPQEIAQVSGGAGPNRFLTAAIVSTSSASRGAPALLSNKSVYMS